MYGFQNLFNIPNMHMPNISAPNTDVNKAETYYAILGITNTASPDEIKKAYRKLSLEYHPDRNHNDEEKGERYKKINEAYATLSSETERKTYDLSINNPFASLMGGQMGGSFDVDPSIFMNMVLNSPETQSILNEMTKMPFNKGLFSDPISRMALGKIMPDAQFDDICPSFSRYNYDSKPKILYKTITIKLLEACNGCKLPINITRWVIEDSKKSEQTETVYLNIPRGIDNNEIITIKDKGNRVSNTNRGDIEVKILIDNNTAYERNGIDLIFKKTISLKESLCGFSFDLQYIDGREFKINNEAGNIIPPDFRKIIPNLGIERDGEKGNLIIIFDVIYPKHLSSEQIDKLKEIL